MPGMQQYFHMGRERPKHTVCGMHGNFPVKALLFDMDNTLFDLVAAKLEACRVITREIGAGSPDVLFSYFLRRTKGFEDPENIRDFMVETGTYSDDAYAWSVAAYRDVKLSHIEPYPGVGDTLSELKRREYPLVLVTDAHHRDALPRLEKTGLKELFSHIITHDMTWEKKPSHIPFLCALRALGIPARDADTAMFIGDSPRRDIAPARQIGMYTAYARYGDRFSSTRSDGGAHVVLDDIRRLLLLLEHVTPNTEERERSCAAGLL